MKKVGYYIKKKNSKDGIGYDYYSMVVEDDVTNEEVISKANSKHSSSLKYEPGIENIMISTVSYIPKQLIKRYK